MNLFPADHRDAPPPPLALWIRCCVPRCREDGVYGEGVNVRKGVGKWWCAKHYAEKGQQS